jgi:hypothetical protein
VPQKCGRRSAARTPSSPPPGSQRLSSPRPPPSSAPRPTSAARQRAAVAQRGACRRVRPRCGAALRTHSCRRRSQTSSGLPSACAAAPRPARATAAPASWARRRGRRAASAWPAPRRGARLPGARERASSGAAAAQRTEQPARQASRRRCSQACVRTGARSRHAVGARRGWFGRTKAPAQHCIARASLHMAHAHRLHIAARVRVPAAASARGISAVAPVSAGTALRVCAHAMEACSEPRPSPEKAWPFARHAAPGCTSPHAAAAVQQRRLHPPASACAQPHDSRQVAAAATTQA